MSRSTAAILHQHNVCFGRIWRGWAVFVAGVVGMAVLGYIGNDKIWLAAALFVLAVVGATYGALGMLMISNLPQLDDNPLTRFEQYQAAPHVVLRPHGRTLFREDTGLTNAEWAVLCYTLAERTNWYISRKALADAGLKIANDRYTTLRGALDAAGLLDGNWIVEHRRDEFKKT